MRIIKGIIYKNFKYKYFFQSPYKKPSAYPHTRDAQPGYDPDAVVGFQEKDFPDDVPKDAVRLFTKSKE